MKCDFLLSIVEQACPFTSRNGQTRHNHLDPFSCQTGRKICCLRRTVKRTGKGIGNSHQNCMFVVLHVYRQPHESVSGPII